MSYDATPRPAGRPADAPDLTGEQTVLPPQPERWIPGTFTRMYGVDTLELRGVCSKDYEGGPGVAHGGWTAAMMDELMGTCVNAGKPVAVTGTLTVVYVKPVPVEQKLICRAQIYDRRGRRAFARGEVRLADSDAVLATAEGVFVYVAPNHYERNQQWLHDQQRH